MKRFIFLALPILLLTACRGEAVQERPPVTGDSPEGPMIRLLFLTHAAGFRHEVLPTAAEVVRTTGPQFGIHAYATEDVAYLSSEKLQDFDAVLFYTSGELPIDEDQKEAFLEFVRAGGGFAGVHSATDTFYEWEEYGRLIGGYFDGHPWHEEVTVRVEDRAHPSTTHFPESFQIVDEIYQFRNYSRDRVHVLISLDPDSVDLTKEGVKRTDRDFAISWTSSYGDGRVFYTALGHREEVWRNSGFQRHLFEGIRWTAGK
jgi:uncharacterized protein